MHPGMFGPFQASLDQVMIVTIVMMVMMMMMMMTKMAMIRIVTTAGVGSCEPSLGRVRNTPDTRDSFLPVSLYYYRDDDDDDFYEDDNDDDDDGKKRRVSRILYWLRLNLP